MGLKDAFKKYKEGWKARIIMAINIGISFDTDLFLRFNFLNDAVSVVLLQANGISSRCCAFVRYAADHVIAFELEACRN